MKKLIFIFCMVFLKIAYAEKVRDIIIDTDMANDDKIAIIYLAKQPEINIKAITIESNAQKSCQLAYQEVKALLANLHYPSIPIACGRATPIEGDHHYPDQVESGGKDIKPSSLPAKTLLISLLTAAKTPLDIIALGPLTTVAEVMETSPNLVKKINRLYFMGGALHVSGNIQVLDPQNNNKVAEWNIYIDPTAAKKVIQSSVPITLIPLDLTNQVQIDKNFYLELKKQNSQAADYFLELIGQYFWDPMAAVIAIHPYIAQTKLIPLVVKVSPEQISGALRIDEKNGNPVEVCGQIDKATFKKLLRQGLIDSTP